MIVVLLGYMASGKSTVGKVLAEKLNYTFLDLDDYIEEKEQNPITNIFDSKGVIYFRRLEHDCLKEIINNSDNLVLSLGGGTPTYGSNMEVLLSNKNATTFYLKGSVTLLVDRLKSDKDKRPLVAHLTNEEDLQEFIGKHLFERNPFYQKSHQTISIDDKSIDKIVEEIILKLF